MLLGIGFKKCGRKISIVKFSVVKDFGNNKIERKDQSPLENGSRSSETSNSLLHCVDCLEVTEQ